MSLSLGWICCWGGLFVGFGLSLEWVCRRDGLSWVGLSGVGLSWGVFV